MNARALLKKFLHFFVGVQFLVTVIGLASVGHEFFQYGRIDEFPKDSWLHTSARNRNVLKGLAKRNVLSSNVTMDLTSVTATMTTAETTVLDTTFTDITTAAMASTGTSADLYMCVDYEECPGGPRISALTILLLAIFVGSLGIGRCVGGFCCLGFVKAFTCGGCGIWWIVDIILVATASWQHAGNGCCFKPL